MRVASARVAPMNTLSMTVFACLQRAKSNVLWFPYSRRSLSSSSLFASRDRMLIENSILVEEIVHTNTYYVHVDI